MAMADKEVTEAYSKAFDKTQDRIHEIKDDASKVIEFQGVAYPVKQQPFSDRAEVLSLATEAVTNDRNNTHGDPSQDFSRTADMWTALGFTFNGHPIGAHNVAMAMVALKLSRSVWSPSHQDHWVDMAGYSACGYEAYVTKDGLND